MPAMAKCLCSVHFTNFSRRNAEPEPSELAHFGRSWSRRNTLFVTGIKKFRLRLRKRKKHKKNVKRENVESIIFTAQFLPLSWTDELEGSQRESTLPRSFPARPVWTLVTMVSFDCTAGSCCTGAGWGLSNRGEASLFI